MVDTHCHLTFPQYDADREEVIERVFSSGIEWVLNACSHLQDLPAMKALARAYPGRIYLSIGMHPHYAGEVEEDTFEVVREEIETYPYVAIGEVGIDLFRNEAPFEVQERVFRGFIRLANECGLPLIVHSRDAEEETLSVLREERPSAGFVVHCFSYGPEVAEKVVEMGGMVSFTANITYKKSDNIRESARVVPLERIMLETDAPYLPPQRKRGQRNDPTAVRDVAETIGQVRGLSVEEVIRMTTENARRFFRVGDGSDATSG